MADLFDDNPFAATKDRAVRKKPTPRPERLPNESVSDHAKRCIQAALTRGAEHQTREKKSSAPAYSTAEAKAIAVARGWTIEMAEGTRNVQRNGQWIRMRQDIPCGMDLLCSTPEGLVAIQAGCVGSRNQHYETFLTKGGPEKARTLGWKILWWEISRDGEILAEEVWAG